MSDAGPSRIHDEEQGVQPGKDGKGQMEEDPSSAGEIAGNGAHLSNDSPLTRAG